MKRWLIATAVLVGGCASGGRPPAQERDALGAGRLSPHASRLPTSDADAQAVFDQYAKRFTEGYPLFAGDQLRIVVLGHAEFSLDALVPVEGSIDYPSIGRVALAGKTTAEVRADIAKRLSDGYIVKPDVSVNVAAYAKRSVTVMGSVYRPGECDLPGGRPITLLQALGMAGGMRDDAEKRAVQILRPKQVGGAEKIMLTVDTVGIVRTGAKGDHLLLPDDVVIVGARDKVYVFGQVVKGGGYVAPADQVVTVSKMITIAGGFTRIARESAVRLTRRNADGTQAQYVIDVSRILDGHPEDDIELQPGDVIFVPESFF